MHLSDVDPGMGEVMGEPVRPTTASAERMRKTLRGLLDALADSALARPHAEPVLMEA